MKAATTGQNRSSKSRSYLAISITYVTNKSLNLAETAARTTNRTDPKSIKKESAYTVVIAGAHPRGPTPLRRAHLIATRTPFKVLSYFIRLYQQVCGKINAQNCRGPPNSVPIATILWVESMGASLGNAGRCEGMAGRSLKRDQLLCHPYRCLRRVWD